MNELNKVAGGFSMAEGCGNVAKWAAGGTLAYNLYVNHPNLTKVMAVTAAAAVAIVKVSYMGGYAVGSILDSGYEAVSYYGHK